MYRATIGIRYGHCFGIINEAKLRLHHEMNTIIQTPPWAILVYKTTRSYNSLLQHSPLMQLM
jgi:hypothetical protein